MRPRPMNLPRVALVAALTLAAIAMTTGLVWLLEEQLGLADASPAYLLAVTAVAVAFGMMPAVAAAAAAVLAYNFLFTHPRFTFIVADSAQLLNLVLLLVVGVVVGQLAGAQRHRVETAERREREAQVLFQISRALALRVDTPSALRQIVSVLERNADLRGAWVGLGSSPGAERHLTAVPAGAPEPSGPHHVLQRRSADEPARWMRVHPPALPSRPGDLALYAYRVPIEAAGRALGSLWALRPRVTGQPRGDETRMLAAAADQIGQALEQDRLRAEATSAELARRSEAMKSALLESVSHDLRTPLSAIRAAAGALIDESARPTDDEQREIGQVIDDEATRMDRLVANLLDISRIEAGGVTLDLQPYALDDLLATSLRRFRPQLAEDRLEVQLPADLPYVWADAVLLDQVVANVMDNALRYAPEARIRLSASAENDDIRLVIEDSGVGVPDEALAHIFDKFYRLQRHPDPAGRGTGIGLTVVRGLVRAMGGQVEAARSGLGGLAIICRLPVARLPAEEG